MNKLNSTLLDAIRSRRAEIQNIRSSLQIEDEELAIAERVAERLEPSLHVQAAEKPAVLSGQANVLPVGTVKQADLVIMTMRSAAQPWFDGSAAVGDEIKRIHGVEIKQNSLFPLISVLKKKGIIVRDGQKIALAERAERAERADGRHDLVKGPMSHLADGGQ